MPPAALVQFRPVSLHPTPHTTGADGQTSLPGHLRHLCHREGVAEIPAHTPHDDVAWIVSPFERIGCGDGHVSPYQIGISGFRNGTLLTGNRSMSLQNLSSDVDIDAG